MGRMFKESPSVGFFPFPAHVLPSWCNTGLFLRSWRPAQKHHQKIQLLPTELFFCLPSSWLAGRCYSRSCRFFNLYQVWWLPRKTRHKPDGAIFRSAVSVCSQSCRIMAPYAVAWGVHNRCLSMDLEPHGQNSCWKCCSDEKHEPAPLESWV